MHKQKYEEPYIS